MATAGRRKKARSLGEAVQKGVKQMDTEDTVGLVAGVAGSAVFFGFAAVSVAGIALSASTGFTLFGADVTYALALALGGALFQLATNQMRQNNIELDAMQQWGAALAIGPTVLVYWNQDFANWVQSDPAIGGAITVVATAGYVLLAAAPTVAMRG